MYVFTDFDPFLFKNHAGKYDALPFRPFKVLRERISNDNHFDIASGAVFDILTGFYLFNKKQESFSLKALRLDVRSFAKHPGRRDEVLGIIKEVLTPYAELTVKQADLYATKPALT